LRGAFHGRIQDVLVDISSVQPLLKDAPFHRD